MRRAMYGILPLLMVGVVACGTKEANPPAASGPNETPSSTPFPTPTATPSVAASSCTQKKATDLTGDDPFVIVIRDFRFEPKCFMADFAAASIAIENKDDVNHTFFIEGTLVDASLGPHQTYKHGPRPGVLDRGTYGFYCSIHPEMTGTMIVI